MMEVHVVLHLRDFEYQDTADVIGVTSSSLGALAMIERHFEFLHHDLALEGWRFNEVGDRIEVSCMFRRPRGQAGSYSSVEMYRVWRAEVQD